MLEYLIHFVNVLHGQPWAAPVFVLTYAIICLTGPITPFPVIGGVLFGFWEGVVFSLAAEIAGACAAFYLGRIFGLRFLERRLGRRYKRFEASMSEQGFRAILIMRLVGFPPFTVVNYLAGMAGVGWKPYLAATVPGILPWTILMTYFSQLLWKTLVLEGWSGFHRAILAHGKEFILAGILLAGLVALQWFLKRGGKPGAQRAGLSE